MRRHALALVGAIVGLSAGRAHALELIDCTSKDGPEVVLALHARTAFGRDLSCIRGGFVSDMTPCAPAGGFGLSAPTGDARLVGIAMDWRARDFANHSGGVTQFLADNTHYDFSGGFKPLDRGWTEEWRFVVSRASGVGQLTVKGAATSTYSCRAAVQKF